MRFDSWHPAVNFIFFGIVVASAAAFNQPVFLAIGYACSFAYSVKLNGKRAVCFNLALIPFIVLFALFYSGYNHFGVTNLAVNFIGNQLTLEALVSGFVIGTRAASVLMWFSCMNAVVSSDKVVYLFGRVSPRLSLFLSILLRMVPRVKERARKIGAAQRAIGRGAGQGGLLRRMRNGMRIASIVITWTMESMIGTSDSMKSRGYTLRGRTAFSIYRFDYRDRSFVLVLFGCAAILLMGILLDQTCILYDPEIILNRITPLSGIFYTAYALLCLLPMLVQMMGERRFARQRKAGCENGA